MRYGVVSDIHGNLGALEAVLRVFDRAGVDQILCAGDVVGYGAEPNQCIRRLTEAGAVAVAGNHDLLAVGRLEGRLPPYVTRSADWTSGALNPHSRAYLQRLPLRASVPGVTLAHGSLDSPQEYVTDLTKASRQLAQLSAESPATPVLILGHTHRAMICVGGRLITPPARARVTLPPNGPVLLNPGSVGQSRQLEFPPRARGLVLEWPAGEVRFVAIGYDTRAARRALRAEGLPRSGLHLWPGRLTARVRDLAASVGRSNRP